MKQPELIGCNCIQWLVAFPQMLGLFMKADSLGCKYTGEPYKFCPWCGTSLVEISKFKQGKSLFFDQKK